MHMWTIYPTINWKSGSTFRHTIKKHKVQESLIIGWNTLKVEYLQIWWLMVVYANLLVQHECKCVVVLSGTNLFWNLGCRGSGWKKSIFQTGFRLTFFSHLHKNFIHSCIYIYIFDIMYKLFFFCGKFTTFALVFVNNNSSRPSATTTPTHHPRIDAYVPRYSPRTKYAF